MCGVHGVRHRATHAFLAQRSSCVTCALRGFGYHITQGCIGCGYCVPCGSCKPFESRPLECRPPGFLLCKHTGLLLSAAWQEPRCRNGQVGRFKSIVPTAWQIPGCRTHQAGRCQGVAFTSLADARVLHSPALQMPGWGQEAFCGHALLFSFRRAHTVNACHAMPLNMRLRACFPLRFCSVSQGCVRLEDKGCSKFFFPVWYSKHLIRFSLAPTSLPILHNSRASASRPGCVGCYGQIPRPGAPLLLAASFISVRGSVYCFIQLVFLFSEQQLTCIDLAQLYCYGWSRWR